jgi:hypothetical protein
MTAPRDIIIKNLNERFGWMPDEIADGIINALYLEGYSVVPFYDDDDEDEELYDVGDLGPLARRDTPFLNLIKGVVLDGKVMEWGMHFQVPATDESPSIQQQTETE